MTHRPRRTLATCVGGPHGWVDLTGFKEIRASSYLLPLAIIGLQGFFPLKGQAAVGVGSIEYPVSERKRLAQL